MKEEIFNGDLIIKGNLDCGKDGIIEADGNITFGFCHVKDEDATKARDLFQNATHQGDFNLAGRKVIVHGNLFIWGDFSYDPLTYEGHIKTALANI